MRDMERNNIEHVNQSRIYKVKITHICKLFVQEEV